MEQVVERIDQQISGGFGRLKDASLDVDPHRQRAGSLEQRPGVAPGRGGARRPPVGGVGCQGNIVCKRGHVFVLAEIPLAQD